MLVAMQNAAEQGENPGGIPSKGDRIELLRTENGVHLRGIVFYADQIQILVRWDNGRSQSLRVGVDRYRIIA
jgi:hypothetical protein